MLRNEDAIILFTRTFCRHIIVYLHSIFFHFFRSAVPLSITGEITTREPLDRELRSVYDLVVEARDQGRPSRAARAPLHVHVTDVNDNAPEIVDPQEDVVSVREEQPPGTEVVRMRAIDPDNGANATITYALLRGRDAETGHGVFAIDAETGVIRTRAILDHEERSIYRLTVAATDGGRPAKQTQRLLRVEVLDLNDNRATFTSSSSVFRVSQYSFVCRVLWNRRNGMVFLMELECIGAFFLCVRADKLSD